MVRVLPQNDHLDTGQRRQRQCPQWLWWVDDGPGSQALADEMTQLLSRRALQEQEAALWQQVSPPPA